MNNGKNPEKLNTADNKYLLFFNYIASDGLGDLGHLIDIANPPVLQKIPHITLAGNEIKYHPVYVICCSDASPQRLRFILDALEDNKLLNNTDHSYDKNNNAQLALYIAKLVEKNPHLHICTDDTNSEETLVGSVNDLLNNTKFLEQISQSAAAYKISVPTKLFDSLLVNKPIMCAEIIEHSIIESSNRFHQFMGLNKTGILLKNHRKRSLAEKANLLLTMHNKPYLTNLLGLTAATDIVYDKAIQFLNTNLFIPGYFQDVTANALFIHTLAAAHVTKNYQQVTFHVNGSAFDVALLQKDFISAQGFSKVTIYRDEQALEEMSLENSIGNRHLKIISDTWINNHDYEILYQVAQLFGGCSGDKSLEMVLSNYLIPFYEERYWRRGFSAEFANLVAEYNPSIDMTSLVVIDYINLFEKLEHIEELDISKLSAKFSQMIDDDFIRIWHDLIQIIHDKYNFAPKLADVLFASICVQDFLTLIENKNTSQALATLALFSPSEINEITKWAVANKFYSAAALIYQHKSTLLTSLLSEGSYQITLDYLLHRTTLDSEKLSASTQQIIFLLFENIKSLISSYEASLEYKQNAKLVHFISQLKVILNENKQSPVDTFVNLVTNLVNNFAIPELDNIFRKFEKNIVTLPHNTALSVFLDCNQLPVDRAALAISLQKQVLSLTQVAEINNMHYRQS